MARNLISMSTVTEKGQATIPVEIRHRLKLIAGDKVGFEVSEGKVFLRRVEPFDYLYHQSLSKTLSEWDSLEDEEAYRDL
ncbi:MAG: AbrB/MazE/SpoVT family DNA-binding domain-containing protein [Myxococcaceae bacterium]